ncbi:hypothetical protein M5K25_017370 [Dendrobium thyrsiflorum]|uniref:Reverse transcriptase zinc-binding domain-containing protein n=1 Tax=Dendrobium thyrsiflorum TaxID=117978 RepID=A0ABD0UM34_DENTH
MYWDPWCNGRSLVDLGLPSNRSHCLVRDFICNGRWALPSSFPEHICNVISNVPILDNSGIAWDGSNLPNFQIFSSHFYGNLEQVTWFKYIWHKKFALRFSVYAWMAILGKLKTYDVLLRRHIYTPSECSFCRVHQETHSHLLFECDFSFSVLSSLLPSVSAFLLRPNISQVFEFLDNTLQLHTLEKNFCFLVVCCSTYFIWRERNNRRFSGKWESPNTVTANIKHAIRLKVKRWKNSEHLFHKFPGFV